MRQSLAILCALLSFISISGGAEIDDARELLLIGKYEECLTVSFAAIEKGVYGEAWHQLKAEAEVKLGKYDDCLLTIQEALKRYNWSVRLRCAGMQVCRYAGHAELVETYIEEIAKLVQSTPWRYTDVENLIALGNFSLDQGADAKTVQEAFFQRARRNYPQHRLPILALGNLALDKRDFELAAELFRPAVKQFPTDPDFQFGLSQAIRGLDADAAAAAIEKCLKLNPKHDRAILTLADRLIDGEKYDEAVTALQQLLDYNPKHPEGLAVQSVIQSLQEKTDASAKSREQALASWSENPLVDHVIGRKLSQKYRFKEGAKHQRQALTFDPDYLPAKKQLAQDLLRIGDEAAGWQLADEIYQRDQYDVAIYNLVTLRDALDQFTTLEEGNFTVRMDAHEARVYGSRVLRLLKESRQQLCEKYKVELPENILVEIFPNPADFAVRTFGMPAADGYLGVCFGDVITANSPASQTGNPSNWEAVLWHEFAHVVTLNKTNNRMPRWLSEGISVYEERQRDAAWGEQMNQPYQKMILGGELTKVGDLSEAFLSPKSSTHLQFAYYESSLVVQHIVDEYGFDALIKILDDLSEGMSINEALERHTVPLKQLEEDFEAYATKLASEFGADVDWSKPDLEEIAASDFAIIRTLAWAEKHPRNYVGLKECADILIRLKDVESAIDLLERAVKVFPFETGEKSASLMLANLYQERGETEKSLELLKRIASLDDDAAHVFLQIIEFETAAKNWPSVLKYAEKLVAVNPLISAPHAALSKAAEELKQHQVAVEAMEAELLLDPNDIASVHYRLAQQYQSLGDQVKAKRNVLQALEEAPRYRDALSLLLKLQ